MTILRYLLLSQLLVSAAINASIIRLDRPVPAEYGARVIAFHENRVLIKPDSAVALSTDFVLRFSDQRGHEFICGIAGTLFGFAASDPIADATLEWITNTERLDVVALLDSAQVSERLVIGLPECLRPLAYSLSSELTADSGTLEFRYYSSAQEAEVERKLGRWDIYIVPETEVEAESATVLANYGLGEWHLLLKDEVDDLTATAVNYCVKGALGDAGSSGISTLIHRADIASIFPRNAQKASDLFAGLKKKHRISEVYCAFAKQLPKSSETICRLVSDCQGEPVGLAKSKDSPSAIDFGVLSPFGAGSGLATMNSNLVGHREDMQIVRLISIDAITVLTAADQLSIDWRDGLDSLLVGNAIDMAADSLLSRRLSERCRIIPLGRTRLVAKLGIHARCLQLPGRPATLRHFYSKAR